MSHLSSPSQPIHLFKLSEVNTPSSIALRDRLQCLWEARTAWVLRIDQINEKVATLCSRLDTRAARRETVTGILSDMSISPVSLSRREMQHVRAITCLEKEYNRLRPLRRHRRLLGHVDRRISSTELSGMTAEDGQWHRLRCKVRILRSQLTPSEEVAIDMIADLYGRVVYENRNSVDSTVTAGLLSKPRYGKNSKLLSSKKHEHVRFDESCSDVDNLFDHFSDRVTKMSQFRREAHAATHRDLTELCHYYHMEEQLSQEVSLFDSEIETVSYLCEATLNYEKQAAVINIKSERQVQERQWLLSSLDLDDQRLALELLTIRTAITEAETALRAQSCDSEDFLNALKQKLSSVAQAKVQFVNGKLIDNAPLQSSMKVASLKLEFESAEGEGTREDSNIPDGAMLSSNRNLKNAAAALGIESCVSTDGLSIRSLLTSLRSEMFVSDEDDATQSEIIILGELLERAKSGDLSIDEKKALLNKIMQRDAHRIMSHDAIE